MATSITTTSEFLNMSLSGDYILEADLDFGGAEIVGIGQTSETFFTGHFDGNYHTISNYRIDFSNVGTLFYGVGLNGIVERLTIDNGKPQTGYYAGMIAGWTEENGIIRDCKVMNTEMYLSSIQYGGVFVGRTMDTSKVENCFAVNITTNTGSLDGAVSNILHSSTVSDCFYVDNNDITDNGNGTPLTDSEARTKQTFLDAGWDTHIWKLEDGNYPVLEFTPQIETRGVNVPLELIVSSQTILERLSDGSMVDISVDVNSQILLEKFSSGNDVSLELDINSQTLLEKYQNGESINIGIGINSQTLLEKIKKGSNIDLNIDINSQQLEVIQKGAKVELQIYVSKRRRILLVREEVLLADLKRGVILEAGRRN